MKRYSLVLITLAALASTILHAQSATPGMIADIKKQYNDIKNNLVKAAEKMSDDGYSFQPVKEVRTFGGWVGHVADAQTRGCSRIAGAQKDIKAGSKTTKAELVAALKESFETCDAVFDGLTEANANDPVPAFGGQRPRLTALTGNISHDNECYGSMAVYLRLKGIVPPSSEKGM